ncbi:hypothetical protein [Bacillus sp. FSL R12-0074]|uniref:hypothetical protein n=1 Tax=Bacillus sp. FSL R12-0074 TaxID=2954664 RepID=UPI0030F6D165
MHLKIRDIDPVAIKKFDEMVVGSFYIDIRDNLSGIYMVKDQLFQSVIKWSRVSSYYKIELAILLGGFFA